MARISKNKKIMTKPSAYIRVMMADLGNPAGFILYGMYHEPATAIAGDLRIESSSI
ncbi:MAG: hypothetical protein GWP70_00360 [Proteobacteria bacterium]|nr:hypothetical protein [Pseudomonadota bacterium]